MMGQGKTFYLRLPFENPMDRPSEGAGALAVNNPELIDLALSALGNIIPYHAFHLVGCKGMQIKDAINRILEDFTIHKQGDLRSFYLSSLTQTLLIPVMPAENHYNVPEASHP